jgi:hypothetical protein
VERETDLIVQKIQEFLSTLRNTEEFRDLAPIMKSIKLACDNVINHTTTLIDSASKRDISKNVKYVLEDLEMYSRRLESFFDGKSTDFIKEGRLDKIAKQRLAASAYDIAKSTKELVALFGF